MMGNRNDFISSYCDRWCERCAFTARCSAYASEIAVGMCGNTADGLELALGMPKLASRENPECFPRATAFVRPGFDEPWR